jgi:hypothetical protein
MTELVFSEAYIAQSNLIIIRGKKVLLNRDLAALYGMETAV